MKTQSGIESNLEKFRYYQADPLSVTPPHGISWIRLRVDLCVQNILRRMEYAQDPEGVANHWIHLYDRVLSHPDFQNKDTFARLLIRSLDQSGNLPKDDPTKKVPQEIYAQAFIDILHGVSRDSSTSSEVIKTNQVLRSCVCFAAKALGMETPGTIKYQISLIQNGMLYFSSRESVVGKLLLDRLDSLYTSFGKLQRTFPNTIRVPPGSPPELSSRAGGHLRFIQGSLEDIQSEIERIERAKTIPSPFRYLRITERIENELDYIQEEIKALREDVIHHVKSTKKSSAGRQEGGLSAILANEGIDITRSRDLESAENILNTLFVRLSNIETKSKKGKIHAFFQPEGETTVELQAMITRTRVIGTQFPELSESAHFLQERIQSYMQLTDSLGSPLVEVPRIVPQTRKSPSVESLEIQITPDTQKIVHFLTTYLTWITRVGSSTNDTKTGSKGDGNILNQYIFPYFSFIKNEIKKGAITAENFSFSQSLGVFTEATGLGEGNALRNRALPVYLKLFPETTPGASLDTQFTNFLVWIERVGDLIESGVGCRVLLKHSHAFFRSPECQKILKR